MEKITVEDVVLMIGSELALKDGRFGTVHMIDLSAGHSVETASVFIELDGEPEDGFHYIAVCDGYDLTNKMVPINRFNFGDLAPFDEEVLQVL